MSLVSSCPICGTRYRTVGMPADRRLKCKQCGCVFTVSEQEHDDSSDLDGAVSGPRDANAKRYDTEALPAVMGDPSSIARAGVARKVDLICAAGKTEIKGIADQDRKIASIPNILEDIGGTEKYVVQDEIARGGMGRILRVVDRDIRREVAMKVIIPDAEGERVARFVEEVQVTGQLEHPNIVPIHDFGIDRDGRLFFTMKMVKGRSLADIIDDLRKGVRNVQRKYSIGRLLGILMNVGNAVAFAHSRGVVHRDLKPANIMVGDFGEVMVMDWGVAIVVDSKDRDGAGRGRARKRGVKNGRTGKSRDLVSSLRKDTDTRLTMEGCVVGTPLYMSPEQARGDPDGIGRCSDIYALGAILYEMLTFRPPVSGDDVRQILHNVAAGNIALPEEIAPHREIPPELSAIAMKALAFSPRDRYPKVRAMMDDIELYLEGRAVSAKEDTPWETIVKLVNRNRTASIIAMTAAVILVAVAGWALRVNSVQRERAEEARRAAQEALAKFKVEQKRRCQQQRKAAPAFVEMAKRSLEDRDFAAAMTAVDAAITYAPDMPEARLLKAQLMIHGGGYTQAAKELREYLRLRPDDDDASKLRMLCMRARDRVTPAVNVGFYNTLMRQKAYALAESMVRGQDKMLDVYRARIEKAWPGLGKYLSRDSDMKYSFNAYRRTEILHLLPLKGIPLKYLRVDYSRIKDLAPLRGMPLEFLNLNGTSVSDLSPLKNMPLKKLYIYKTQVFNLEPLAGMRLEELNLGYTAVSKLAPLQGMPIKILNIASTPVSELWPLRGMPLVSLNMIATSVANLSPLAGMKIRTLYLNSTAVHDLSLLEKMPVVSLGLSGLRPSDFSPLYGKQFDVLDLRYMRVSDVKFLANLRVKRLAFTPGSLKEQIKVIRGNRNIKELSVSTRDYFPAMEFWKRYDAGEFLPHVR